MFRKCVILIVFLSVIITACKSQTIPEPTLTPINTVVPTLTPTPAPTAISTPTRRELAEEYFLRGVEFQEEREWDLAIDEYSEAISIDPDYAEAYINRGLCFYFSNDPQAAISIFETALELDYEPQSPQMYVNRGRAYSILGETEKSLSDFSQAIDLDPEFIEAYVRRGNIYAWVLNDFENAFKDFEIAISIDPDYALTYQKRGYAYTLQGDYDLANEDYNLAIDLNEQDAYSYSARGEAYYNLGDLDQAILDLDKAIELDPQNIGAYYYRGIAYADLGDHDLAIADFDRVIELDPQYSWAYYERGYVYWVMDDLDQAIADLDQAIELDPNHGWAYYFRGLAYADLGDYDRTIDDLDKAIELDPQEAYFFFMRGLLHTDLAETENAVADLEKAIEMGLGPDEEEYALTTLDELSSLPAVKIFQGETSQGEKFSFKVEDGEITALEVGFDIPGCETYSPYAQLYVNYPIDENTISIINTNLEITGSFDSPDSASGSMRIHPAICDGEVDVIWSASTNFVPPIVNIPERALPEMEIPEGLFNPEAGDDKFYQPGISSQGDWFLYTSGMESMLPIPAGWSTNETGQETHIMFFEKGRPNEPSIFIRLAIIPEFDGGTDPSTATINEISDNLKALDVHKILATETLDNDKGYILANLNHESDTSEMMLLFTSRSMNNPSGPFTHLFAAYSATTDWDGYYPIVRAMLEKWFVLDSTPLGAQLPESLNE